MCIFLSQSIFILPLIFCLVITFITMWGVFYFFFLLLLLLLFVISVSAETNAEATLNLLAGSGNSLSKATCY